MELKGQDFQQLLSQTNAPSNYLIKEANSSIKVNLHLPYIIILQSYGPWLTLTELLASAIYMVRLNVK